MVSRVALLNALHDIAGPVEFSATVTDPTALPHDVVIGADGVNSAIRRYVSGSDIVPRNLGITVVIAQFPGVTEMFTEYWGPGGSFGITPLSSDRCDWHAAYRSPKSGTPEAEHERDDPLGYVLDRHAEWTDDVTSAIESSAPGTSLDYHVRTVPRFRGWHRGNVALIGDAVHAMAPNLGRGACETMLDAADLADRLGDLETDSTTAVDRAFAEYERARRGPAHRIAAASRLMCRAGMMSRGTGVRNLLMKAMP